MAEKINGIILNVRKYNDRNLILTVYTRERGRVPFITPSGTGRSGNARRARLQPLSVIQTDINYKPGTELQRLGSISSPVVWTDIYFNPVKRTMALFISEFLYRLLNAALPDSPQYDFLLESLGRLDTMREGVEDFHIVFLVAMLTFTGIQPDVSDAEVNKVFDFAAGAYVNEYEAKGPFLKGQEAAAVRIVSRLNYRNIKRLRLTNANRRQILYGLLNYFSYHVPGLAGMKSPDVLREIFS